jgi:FixJ family two-component response regulator
LGPATAQGYSPQSALEAASQSGTALQSAMAVAPINTKKHSTPAVCVVEPDVAEARRIDGLLGAVGAAMRRYADGAALLAEPIDDAVCVISEMALPDMTGADLISTLRRRGVQVPVILLAAESDVASAVAGIRAGALDYIDKTQMERLLSLHLRRLVLEDASGSGDQED